MRWAAVGTFQAFRMAALGGARAVGLQDKTGLVEAGRSADLVLFDLANSLSILPRTDILGYHPTPPPPNFYHSTHA
jgi:cytosine/adenosine deaminase-related metal-dependent hydrolase